MDLTIIAWLLILEAIPSVAAAFYTWSLHARSRADDLRHPKPTLRLSLVLAITSTIGAAASGFLAVASILYLRNHDDGLVRSLGIFIYLMFPILGLISIINAAYLRWLDRKPGRVVK